ncbi:MAG TPA: HYR domain-containing protein [Candidatus Acidoferrum sp.]|jgi:hypothetical protein|nr:HYR domain-containing protein [Candidatus Acidoferrum sp.]
MSCAKNQIPISNALTSVVTFSPVVSDNCSGVGLPICSPASGTAFSVGLHSVTCSVTDAEGNSNQCAFQVTVIPGTANLIVIAGNGTNATVVFDGSRSYDPDDTNFNYYWYEGTNRFSTSVVASRVLSLGLHKITLQLDDTFPLGVSTASVMVEVISAGDALANQRSCYQEGCQGSSFLHPPEQGAQGFVAPA